jgi:Zn-dependent protease with chaperone function
VLAEYASQSITHVVVAACVAQGLVGLWRVHDPDLRVAFRLLPLVFPTLVLPAFLALAPWRNGEAFRDGAALFAGARWSSVAIGGLEVGRMVFVVLVLAGVALLLVDVVRIVARLRTPISRIPPVPAPAAAALADEVDALARALGARPPAVVTVDTPEPMLFVRGLGRPVLVVSRGALDRLDARERHAVLAHEIVHVARRDTLTGWVLLACRVALAFNPAVQVVARVAARELECRADEIAARATDRDALESALVKLARGGGAAVRRRERLRAAAATTDPAFGGLRLAGASAGLAVLLFFVV